MRFVLTYEMKELLWEMSLCIFAVYAIILAAMFVIPWLWEKTKWMRMNFRMWLGFKVRQYQRRQRIKRYYRELNKIDPPTFRPPYWDGRRGWR